MITSQENTMHMNGQDHKIVTKGQTTDQVQGGNHTTTSKYVVYKKWGE